MFVLNSKKKAQSLIEYALILAMVAVVAIAALQLLGTNISTTLRSASDTIGVGAENAAKQACESMGDGFSWTESDGDDSTAGSCNYSVTGGGGE